MELYNSFTAIIVLTAVFGYVHFHFIKLPDTIRMMIIKVFGNDWFWGIKSQVLLSITYIIVLFSILV